MAYEENNRRIGQPSHSITLDSRRRLSITGVDEVESFDENAVSLSTQEGYLMVRGCDLHIEKLNLDGGELLVEGTIDSITYEEQTPRQSGLFGRLFRP